MSEKFYITTAIAYSSRKPHIGNTYEVIATDAIARYNRLCGKDVFFLTGTDEHGQKIEDCARDAGISPQEYVDNVSGEIRRLCDLMNVSYDKFIRTTDDYHERVVQNIFKKLYDNGDIYKSEYEGHYCVPCESFFTDTQVVDGKCPDCGRPVTKMKEEAYFLRMSKYQDRLLAHIEANPDFIVPESRKKEMVNNFLKPGLQDLCVSRSSFKWGVPVSFDDRHVIYVWIDALSNYITALGYDVDEKSDLYKKYWPADIHVIGKDILRFHTIYWPIILMALGEPLPKQVFGHPWLNFGTDKMSKSKGNVIYADDLAEKIGVDGVRYYSLAEMPYASDGAITPETIAARYNSSLANNLGNLVSRTLAMTQKYFDCIVPGRGAEEGPDAELVQASKAAYAEFTRNMDTLHVADAVESVFNLLRRANKYIDETAPWVLAKDPDSKGRLGTVLYNLLETLRISAIMLQAILPETANKILSQLSVDPQPLSAATEFGLLASGTVVHPGAPLFARVDEKEFVKGFEAPAAPLPPKPEPMEPITIDDFMKVELRSATILSCEPVPKSDKLLKLMVDLGYEQRQVVSGIAKFYKPQDLIGKKVALVTNLLPVKLRGVESNGMILASGEEDVKVLFLDPSVKNGERIR